MNEGLILIGHSLGGSVLVKYLSESYTSKSSMFSIGLTGGFQKAIGSYKRIEPYLGLELSLTYSYSSETRERVSTVPYSFDSKTESKSPLQLGLSILPLAGLNYYITPGCAIGAEYRLSIARLNYSANAESENTSTISFSNDTITSKSTQDKGAFSFNGAFQGTGFVTVTFFLR